MVVERGLRSSKTLGGMAAKPTAKFDPARQFRGAGRAFVRQVINQVTTRAGRGGASQDRAMTDTLHSGSIANIATPPLDAETECLPFLAHAPPH